ncbi:MAG TPA: BTAD domain-containing putative transcriptional regulator, partial [Gemmatimonadales bacterium]|nr:BTAD domain-containing putative transcriptional regulator [Gemmatimonadales bacterium]
MLAQPKRVALLVYLAVEGRRGPVSRDRVLGLFWPESDEPRARNTLSQALHYLRQALGAEVIVSQGASTIGIRADQLWCDATAFVDALERGQVELALDLYRGDFCPTLFTSGMPEVEQWLDVQRRRLRTQALTAARAMAEGLLARGDRAAAIRAGRRAMALEPDDEADVRALISLLDQAGDRTGALHAYQEYARRLAGQLETEPEPETRRLIEAIRHRPSPAAGALGEAADPPATTDTLVNESSGARAASPSTTGAAGRLRRNLLRVGAAAVLLTALGGAVTLRGHRHPASPPVRTIAVLPFTLRGGTGSGYLEDGMVDLLAAKLGDASGFQVIDPRSVIAAAGKAEDGGAAPVARQLGAGWYVRGEVLEVAGRLQLTGSLYQAGDDGHPVTTASVVGDTAAIFEMVDELTGRMLAGLLPGRDTALTNLAALTTHSLPALKSFLLGERALRRGHDAEAAEAFRTAADIDTTFALAQYRLALTATWVSVPGAANPTEWAAKAARNADRLSPLGRDLLDAFRAYKQVRIEDAESRYRDLVEAHPDNVEAWFMLGETRFHYNPIRGRSPASARQAFERVLALDPSNLHAMIHLARLAASEGRVAEVDSLAARYAAVTSDAERGLEMRALKAFVHDDPAEWARVTTLAREADDRIVISVLQAAMFFAQNVVAARGMVQPFVQTVTDSIARFGGVRFVTDLGVMVNDWSHEHLSHWVGGAVDRRWLLETESLLATDPAFDLPRETIAALRDSVAARPADEQLAAPFLVAPPAMNRAQHLYRLALLDLRLGDVPAAERAAAELLATRDTARVIAVPMGHALRAELARQRGRLTEALAEIQKCDLGTTAWYITTNPHWGVRERFL